MQHVVLEPETGAASACAGRKTRRRVGRVRVVDACVRVALTYLPPRHFAFFDSIFATVVASDASGAQTKVGEVVV